MSAVGASAPVRAASSSRSGLGTVLALGAVRTRVELLLFRREKDALFFSFFFPIAMLALFSAVFGQGDDPSDGHGGSVPYAQYFLPGIMAAGIVLVSFQSLAISIAVERGDGTVKRLASTPLPPASYFLGKCGMVLIVTLAQAGVLLAVAGLLFGVHLPGDAGRWVTFAWVFVLGTASGALLGVAYSSVPRTARSASTVVAAPVLLLQFISGVYFAFPDLPRWLQNVAAVFPLKWVAQGFRSVFLPDGFAALETSNSWQHGITAAVLAGWAALGLVLCLRTFSWRARRS